MSKNLRPTTLSEYIGQDHVKDVLQVALDAAKKEGRPLDHVLLNGPPGLGKTTLARIIASELKWPIKTAIGSDIKTAKDVGSIALTIYAAKKLVMFIDEIHRVGAPAQEVLYPILEDGTWYYKLGESVTEVKFEKLTVVGATTIMGKLQQPFVDRFGLVFQLEYYSDEEMLVIVTKSAEKMSVDIGADGLMEVVRRGRATPRIANNLLKRLRDYNVARGIKLTRDNVAGILWKSFHLDELGLNSLDRRVLRAMDQAGGPVGIETIATLVNEDVNTIESRVEPFLLRRGMIMRSMRGRSITDGGRNHLVSL